MDGGASKRPCNLDTGNPCRYDGQRRTGFVIPSETFCIFPDAVALHKTLAAGLQTPQRFAATPCRRPTTAKAISEKVYPPLQSAWLLTLRRCAVA